MVGFVDSDYASDFDRRIFITGYVFTLSNYAIRWEAKFRFTSDHCPL